MRTISIDEAERWARYWAKRYSWACSWRHDIDADDLAQAAFMGILAAEKTFSERAGKSFKAWSVFYIRQEIRALLGIRDGRLKEQPVSLDSRVAGDDETLTLEQTIADDSLPPADERLIADDQRAAITAAISGIKDSTARFIWEKKYTERLSIAECAQRLKIDARTARKALEAGRQALQRNALVRAIWTLDDEMPIYRHVGIREFERTQTRETEKAVLWREQQLAIIHTKHRAETDV